MQSWKLPTYLRKDMGNRVILGKMSNKIVVVFLTGGTV